MPKKIITIGYEIPGFSGCYINYRSDRSLLDADVILFDPSLSCYQTTGTFQGKASFSEDESFRIIEDTEHWKRELDTTLRAGKTVIIFMSKYNDIFVHTGKKERSGKGKMGIVTNIVTEYDNYKILPIEVPTLIPKSGEDMTFLGNPIFAGLNSEFKQYMQYESYFDTDISSPIFSTKVGRKAIGGIFNHGDGHLVILPPIRYSKEEFIKKEGKQSVWTEEAIQFGHRLLEQLLDIDEELRKESDRTPPPPWLNKEDFVIPGEVALREKVNKICKEIEALEKQKEVSIMSLRNEESLKDLMYAKGKHLEAAILQALRIIGYNAENFDDGELELDSVIVSPERDRFIGEAEGKDNNAINIDKFRQLESNIQEDLQRNEVKDPATGILFANGFRLVAPEDRPEQFTDKCIRNANRLKVVLIRTMDLFKVTRYIKESKDEVFAKRCREAIKNSQGNIVDFPEAPSLAKSTE